MRELGPLSPLAPAFPLAAATVAPLRARAEAQGSGDFSPLCVFVISSLTSFAVTFFSAFSGFGASAARPPAASTAAPAKAHAAAHDISRIAEPSGIG